jgi:uncharacterized membrane protein YvlD (DUF360 family)
MIRFLINTAVFFASALIGIIAADLILSGFTVSGWTSYVVVAIIFALIQAILSPLIAKMVRKNASAFLGGVGLVSTFVALLLTSLLTSSLTIDGATTWVLATLIVWLFTALAAFLLPFLVVKRVVEERRS